MTEVQTDNVDAFFEKLNQAADVVTQKLVAVAPEAAEAMLSLVQAKGAFDLGISTLFILASIALAKVAIKTCKKAFETHFEPLIPAFMVTGVLSAISLITGGAGFINFYNWVAAFYPEGAIAMKALEAVGIDL